MRLMTCALALSAVAAVPAFATDAPAKAEQQPQQPAARTVYVCDSSAMTRRAFTREHGAMEFVTAEAAAAKGKAWTAPKCMTPAEARRLKELAKR